MRPRAIHCTVPTVTMKLDKVVCYPVGAAFMRPRAIHCTVQTVVMKLDKVVR